jgi:hypothetical protein
MIRVALSRFGIGLGSGAGGIALAFALAVGGCTTRTDHIGSSQERPSFGQFAASVYQEPWRNGLYIVDGDTPIADMQGLYAFYNKLYGAGELIVHQVNGVDAKWNSTQQHQLTYCVAKDSFGANYDKVVEAMRKGTAEGWEHFADVKFIHVDTEDGNCNQNNDKVLFDVRQVTGQPYLARSFFPNFARADRSILVDTSSFDPTLKWPLSGILGHETGHTLGFRHEHTRPEAGTCFEDNDWRPLTPYDSASIMHYPQCNGTGTPLTFSDLDKKGVAILYAPPGGGSCGDGICFEGNETCQNCEKDCGKCPACGDGICNGQETCQNCPGDCGKCPVCGDGICNGQETCQNCPGDCGTCPACAHDVCASGVKLDATCSECATKVCKNDAYCCKTEWDSLCISDVKSLCGQTCP